MPAAGDTIHTRGTRLAVPGPYVAHPVLHPTIDSRILGDALYLADRFGVNIVEACGPTPPHALGVGHEFLSYSGSAGKRSSMTVDLTA
jgi:hypothetical protein